MLSRRDLFRTTAAAGAAAAAGALVTARPLLAQGASRVVDLTHELHEGFPTYFGEQQLFYDKKSDLAADGFNLFELRLSEHTGTHLDAPLHFSDDGHSVAEVPIESLIAPLAVIDIRERSTDDPDARLTPDDIAAWSAANGPLPERCCVAMNSGWAAHVSTDRFRNVDGEGKRHFPGVHPEAAQMLLEESSAVGIAVDTLSLDYGPSPDFATHKAWLPANRWGIEAIANLDMLPAAGATIVVGAPKHRGGSGGPSRVIAML